MGDVLTERKKHLVHFLKAKKTWIIYLVLAFLVWFSFKMRTSNLGNLIDKTTGNYIPLALDPFVFLRYAKELLTTGSLAAVDMLRYFPNGYTQVGEFSLLTNFIVGLYKFLHFFSADITLEYVHVIYPPFAFSITLIFFFLLVRKLFDGRIALLATAYLTFIPVMLYRTVGGFADKESFAIMLLIITFYFYVSALMDQTRFKSIFYGLLAGLFTGLTGLTWGGVQFLFLILGLFALVELVFGKFKDNDFYTYLSWMVGSYFILLFFPSRYAFSSLLLSPITAVAPFALLMGFIDYIFRNHLPAPLKNKLQQKLPLGVFSFIFTILGGLFFIIIIKGFSFVLFTIKDNIAFLTTPFSQNRWGLTVAESNQPYMRDVLGQLGNLYFFLFLAGSVLLFYTMVKQIKKHKYKLTAFYTLFILCFLFSRYSPQSTLNGTSGLSVFMYLGSLSIFVLGLFAFYIYTYKKDKETYQHIINMNKLYTLVFVWFFVKIVAARIMVRLVMLLALITVILVAYLFITSLDFALKRENKLYKYALLVLLLILVFNPAISGTLAQYYQATTNTARSIGPSYNQQWQVGMHWVRNNIPEDAVFISWWDYGYWIQTGGERATISDGGNSGGSALNYYTARNVLTSPSETDALAFIKAKQATHFLTLADDIGKYPAYSSIGSDLENDRYSWLNIYTLDPSRTEERRNQTVYVYGGGTVLDEDIIYKDTLFPERNAGIGGFLVPVIASEDSIIFERPTAVLIYNSQQYPIPLNCLVFNNERIIYGNDGLDGCLLLVPSVQGNQLDPKGSAIYLSKKVKDSMFARLYLYGEETDHFKLVYTDKDQLPLAVLEGRLIGPLNIWEVTVPAGIEVDEKLKSRELPDPRLYFVVQ